MITVEQVEARLWEFELLDEAFNELILVLEQEPIFIHRRALPEEVRKPIEEVVEGLSKYVEGRGRIYQVAELLKPLLDIKTISKPENQITLTNALSIIENGVQTYQPMSISFINFLNTIRQLRGAEPYVFTAPLPAPQVTLPRKFTYSPHALDSMRKRHIHKNQVEKAVLSPDRLTEDPARSRWVAERDTSAGNFIRVVYAETPNGVEIVTTVITAIRITP
ncbi:DUF4258 domain-containing protein [Deinococcus ruber]|uniref:DUF4258 domain-containing protein n=1 Tax=Deinococcus ruber TaxID=1848197 RepID=UPI001669844C|nr:DUF4258 domain-containing protein [Deinococcus ruber]